MTMVPVRVLRDVRVADAGSIYGREVFAGTDDMIPSALFDGLQAAGYVAAPEQQEEPAAEPAQAIEPAAVDEPEIPADWRNLHHKTLVSLARRFDRNVETKAEAIFVLEREEKALAAPANKALGAAPENKSA
jgi:hypothetical protein